MSEPTRHIPGLLADAWREPAAERASALYRPAQASLAHLLAMTHQYAIDYLEQCPALLAFASWGYASRKPEHRMLIARRFGGMVSRGPKLREIVEQFQGAYPLRRIKGKAITGGSYRILVDMRTLSPSELSQMIPASTKEQERWLRGMHFVRWQSKRLAMSKVDPAWRWGAKAVSAALAEGVPQPENQLHTIFDFIGRSNRPLNPSWTFRSALEAAEDWHRELRVRTEAESFTKHHGLKIEEDIDYYPLPNDPITFGGYEFLPLRSGEALFTEGEAMRHCVASYVRDVIAGSSRIFSVRKQGFRVATLELAPSRLRRGFRSRRLFPQVTSHGFDTVPMTVETVPFYRVQQLKGRCNSQVPNSLRAISEGFVAMINGEDEVLAR